MSVETILIHLSPSRSGDCHSVTPGHSQCSSEIAAYHPSPWFHLSQLFIADWTLYCVTNVLLSGSGDINAFSVRHWPLQGNILSGKASVVNLIILWSVKLAGRGVTAHCLCTCLLCTALNVSRFGPGPIMSHESSSGWPRAWQGAWSAGHWHDMRGGRASCNVVS